MKTLINKANPAIRITAPEIESYREFYTLPDKDFHHLFKMETWTLVEEEYIENRNDGTYTCSTTNDFEEEPKKQTSKYLKEPIDTAVVEKMSKKLAGLITDQIVEPVDLEKETEMDFEKLALEKYPETMTYDSRGLYDRKKYDRDIYKQGLKDGYNLKHKIRNDNDNL